LDLAFFGLTLKIAPQVRLGLFSIIHEIVFHGKGGYDWDTVYNMPIWLRKFTFNKIREWYDKESDSYKKAGSTGTDIDLNNPIKSNIPKEVMKTAQQPNYVTKASKK
jgi:hypothetical protein